MLLSLGIWEPGFGVTSWCTVSRKNFNADGFTQFKASMVVLRRIIWIGQIPAFNNFSVLLFCFLCLFVCLCIHGPSHTSIKIRKDNICLCWVFYLVCCLNKEVNSKSSFHDLFSEHAWSESFIHKEKRATNIQT